MVNFGIREIALVCGGLFILAFGAAGVIAILSYVRSQKKSETCQKWALTPGTVVSSSIHQSTTISQDDPPTYTPQIRYVYYVMGELYQGSRVFIGPIPSRRRSQAEQIVARYPAGATVTVYYDPNKPADAVLERSAPGNTAVLILGILFVVITLCLVCPGILLTLTSVPGGAQ